MKYLIIFGALVAGLAYLVIYLLRKNGKKFNPYLVFGLVDVFVGLLVLGFAIVDFHVSYGEFAGILGQLALILLEPVVGVLLLIDIIVWWYNTKHKKSSGDN